MTTPITDGKTPLERFIAAEQHVQRLLLVVEALRDLPLECQTTAIDALTTATASMIDLALAADRAEARHAALPKALAFVQSSAPWKRGRRG